MAVLSFLMKPCDSCGKKTGVHAKTFLVDKKGSIETSFELCVKCFNKGVTIDKDNVNIPDPPR